MKILNVSFCCLVLIVLASHAAVSAQAVIPNPVLAFDGQSYFETGGKKFTRYTYFVANSKSFPKEMFAASPELPPCGKNTKSSRTWVDIYDQRGKRLNGFCALTRPDDLHGIWFALESDVVPPSYIYIELTDRKTNTKYKSNLVETTL
jgi:hypothetical protein